jgi:hypothetical protein
MKPILITSSELLEDEQPANVNTESTNIATRDKLKILFFIPFSS